MADVRGDHAASSKSKSIMLLRHLVFLVLSIHMNHHSTAQTVGAAFSHTFATKNNKKKQRLTIELKNKKLKNKRFLTKRVRLLQSLQHRFTRTSALRPTTDSVRNASGGVVPPPVFVWLRLRTLHSAQRKRTGITISAHLLFPRE